jgi:hypothetical protein
MTAFHSLAEAYIYCQHLVDSINSSLYARAIPIKVDIVIDQFAPDLQKLPSYKHLEQVSEALNKLFLVKIKAIEEYATEQEGRNLYCNLIVKNIVFTGTAHGDGTFYIRNVNIDGITNERSRQININQRPS